MQIPSDLDCVNLCAQLYDGSGQWDHHDAGIDDGVCWAFKSFGAVGVVVLRGSKVAHDWIEDFCTLPVASRIGTVHSGFYDGMEKMAAEMADIVKGPAIVTGHSLGAARADILCALMLAAGKPPLHRVVFGEPRSGMQDFCARVALVPGAAYCNGDDLGHDHVCDVPFDLKGYFAFTRPTPLVGVTARLSLADRCDPLFGYHHISLYQAALAAASQEKAA